MSGPAGGESWLGWWALILVSVSQGGVGDVRMEVRKRDMSMRRCAGWRGVMALVVRVYGCEMCN